MADPTATMYGVPAAEQAIQHHDIVLEFIKHYWSLLLVVGAFIVTIIINVKYRIPEIVRRLSKLEYQLKDDETQTGLRMLESDCKIRQDQCQSHVCKKIEEVKAVNQETQREVKELRLFINRVDRQLAAITSDVNNIKTHVNSHETKAVVENIVNQLRPLIIAGAKAQVNNSKGD